MSGGAFQLKYMKKLIVPICLVLAVALSAFFSGRTLGRIVSENKVSGQYNSNGVNAPSLSTTGLVKSNGLTNFQKVVTIPKGENYFFFTNNTKDTIWFDDAKVITAGTASSSVKIFVYATSTNSLLGREHFTNPTVTAVDQLLNGVLISTSTAATSTSPFTESLQASPKTKGIVGLTAGRSMLMWIQNASGASGAPATVCNGATCESATSTRLGIGPVTIFLGGFSTSTVEFNQYQD